MINLFFLIYSLNFLFSILINKKNKVEIILEISLNFATQAAMD